MDQRIAERLAGFSAISLDEMNAKAAMLERQDNKYIIPADRLLPTLDRLGAMFDVLEIDGKRGFTYLTDYFDDVGQHAYNDQRQGRRKRSKVRIRHYVDTDATFLEVKLKDGRGGTVKKRLKLARPADSLSAESLAFIDACHVELYGAPLGRQLAPVIALEFERISLVAREGGERMTIDTGIVFRAANVERSVGKDMFIVEAKSAHGNGIADKLLRAEHLHPTSDCSKYCVGMAALGLVARSNPFLPALRQLNLMTPALAPDRPREGPV